MGEGQTRLESAAEAEVNEEQVRAERLRHAQAIQRQEEAFKADLAKRAERRRIELERSEQEDKRADEQKAAMMERARESRNAEQAREEKMRAENEERLKKTVEEGDAAQDKQRAQNQDDIRRRTTDHQNVMNKTANQIAETEKKAQERIVDIGKQTMEAKNQLYKEKEGYGEKKRSEVTEHHQKMEKLEGKKFEILTEKEENRLEHEKKIYAMQETYGARTHSIKLAGEQDRKESHFADAVQHLRMTDLSSSVSNFGAIQMMINCNLPVPVKVINSCKSSCDQAIRTIGVLTDNCNAILNVKESNNQDTVKCQKIARNVLPLADEIKESLDSLCSCLECLESLSTDEERSRTAILELVNKVQAKKKEIFEQVNSLPCVKRKDYVTTEITQSIKSIAGSSRLIEGPSTGGPQSISGQWQ
ncbi:unnamed protein product [Caenorhabditis sp. 36 PRJEB53466]|nr:unnamed protein product [Caenorhabditis sp. 36 PRJEB53466]